MLYEVITGGSAVAASVSYNAGTLTATLTPSNALGYTNVYTVVLTNGAAGVKDLAGNGLTEVYSTSFTTQAPDTTAPTVVSVDPVDGAVGVALNMSTARPWKPRPIAH